MSLNNIKAGKNIPQEVNVVIEIPMHGDPVKYEVDKETGMLSVDRFMSTSMRYPVNYGYVPQTLAKDGDPVDVLVLTPCPLINGAVIRCRPIGMLKMTDESGEDAKILAVPVDKLSSLYRHIKTYEDLLSHELAMIEHFFKHYKDLDEGKWVKIDGWEGVEQAYSEINESIASYQG